MAALLKLLCPAQCPAPLGCNPSLMCPCAACRLSPQNPLTSATFPTQTQALPGSMEWRGRWRGAVTRTSFLLSHSVSKGHIQSMWQYGEAGMSP